MAPKITVIIATLGRPSLQPCLDALRAQTLPRSEWELITWAGGPNEYAARNEAAQRAKGEVIAWTDDDCLPTPDWLATGWRHFADDPGLKILTGPVEGDMWAQGWMRISKRGWFIGANIMTRRDAFLGVGGFEALWGLDPPPRGWRGDTDLGWRFLDAYGEGGYGHFEDVVVHHPKMMQSKWDTRVEAVFYRRHKARILTEITPYDPRICQFVTIEKLEDDPLIKEYLTSDQKVRADFARLNAEGTILDLGCSDGWTFHGTRFDWTGFDVDRYALPEFVQGEATRLPFADGSFDTVYAGEILEHVREPEALVREAVRVARKKVLITTPDERSWDPSKVPMLTREERMARDGFSDVDSMQGHFTGQKVGVKQVVPESRFPHTWHVNWPTEESLEGLFSNLRIRHEVSRIRQGGFTWFAVRAWK